MTLAVAVTGGTGFIGKKLIKGLLDRGFRVISLQRGKSNSTDFETRYFDLSSTNTINKTLLSNIDVLIHTASLVHNKKTTSDSYRMLNYEATKQLFDMSKEMSLKKFIYLSTVDVYGVSSHHSAIDINSSTQPKTNYAKSKLQSERYLLSEINNKVKTSVIRLPFVYYENIPGNYCLLDKISKMKESLPFGFANNKRSMISVDVLIKVLADACDNLDLYHGLNLLAEKTPFSTKKLVIQLRSHYGMSPNLLPIPKIFMKIALIMLGKKRIYNQLYEDLTFISSIDY